MNTPRALIDKLRSPTFYLVGSSLVLLVTLLMVAEHHKRQVKRFSKLQGLSKAAVEAKIGKTAFQTSRSPKPNVLNPALWGAAMPIAPDIEDQWVYFARFPAIRGMQMSRQITYVSFDKHGNVSRVSTNQIRIRLF